MLFPTVEFAVFFAIVLALSWSVPTYGTRWKLLVLSASYFFYGWWDWRFVLLIVASTVMNHGFAQAIHAAPDRRSARAALAGAVAVNLAVLGFFKYAGFFVGSLSDALHSAGIAPPLPLLQVVLPVGISFFTFQAISYCVDVYRRTIEPSPPLDFAVYLSFFPHVVAGPIVRAREFMPQLRRSGEQRLDAGKAVPMIVSGLLKKVVLASFLASNLVDPVFAAPAAHSGLEVLVATYGYAVQIWADFSGYTDIAIGCALLLGIRFPDNFNAPYTARSLRDFWRRWHMTLSRWLRDYLYIPLGGNRRGTILTYRNLMITMLLGGLWHGAAWTFVVWGGIHGVGLCLERLRSESRDHRFQPVDDRGGFLSWLLTFHVVCLAWLFFRADSLGTAWQLLRRIPNVAGPVALITPTVLLAIVVGVGSQFVSSDRLAGWQEAFGRMRPALQGSLLAASLVVVGALGPSGVAPFIYYRF